jgi:hypothetical protein
LIALFFTRTGSASREGALGPPDARRRLDFDFHFRPQQRGDDIDGRGGADIREYFARHPQHRLAIVRAGDEGLQAHDVGKAASTLAKVLAMLRAWSATSSGMVMVA